MPRIARLEHCFFGSAELSGWINANGTVIANITHSSGAERHMNTW